MIREFSIKNYKSIVDLTLDLGRINVFIGENGCGKTNILEAMAMAAAAVTARLDTEELYLRGVRVAKPEITLSSFAGAKQGKGIDLSFKIDDFDVNTRQSAILRLQAEGNKSGSGWRRRYDDALEKMGNLVVLKEMAGTLDRLMVNPPSGADDADVRRVAHLILDTIGPDAGKAYIGERYAEGMFRERAGDFLIYNANHLALRGLMNISRKEPLGIHGENLDVTIASLGDAGLRELLDRSALIRWVERIFTDPEDKLKFEGYKLGRSTSTLYFRDRFMRKRANVFSAENANEGILHALFYLTLFISDRTPKTFGIDNIETALNPRLCRNLIKQLAELSKSHDKQALITTHNPAALDGLDLHDDDQRLFVVARDDAGHTVANRIKLKPQPKDKQPKRMLSEMWMRGDLGGIPLEF